MRHLLFMAPGPPWYAAQCKLEEGHPGECEFGRPEEAKQAFLVDVSRATTYIACRAYIPVREGNEIAVEMIRHAEFW